ncbi:MAG: carboxypeptidase regulatory-like domain-containing protein [Gemmatimonadetes bacterium]|nr:carboxypeptidase regulatory-like domain-containing protein [Gemmatimonadota bacterium]
MPRVHRATLCTIAQCVSTILAISALAVGCTDAPLAPAGGGGRGQLVVVPVFSVLEGQDTVAVAAQRAAWDKLNRFRLILKRVPSGKVAVDTVIVVESGKEEYELGVLVPLQAGEEEFLLELVALQDATPLFKAETVVKVAAAGGGAAPPPVPLAVQYVGPGVEAKSLEVVPGGLVLAPGGKGLLAVRVLDGKGTPIGGVPLAWLSEAESVAKVSGSGEVTGVAEGVVHLVVSTPTGVKAEAWAYVVAGEVAYVAGAGEVVRVGVDGKGLTVVTVGAGGAKNPAWSPNGARLLYELGGEVREAGAAGPLLSGKFPAFSPDASKLVVEGVKIANADGSKVREGPSGETPVWDVDGVNLIVGGGSIERVRADGTGRATLSSGAGDRWPAVSRGGRIAFVSERDGEPALYAMAGNGSGVKRVTPAGFRARGRATWSPNDRWLVVPGSRGAGFPAELYIVAADASAPPVALALEGVEETDPAWRGGVVQKAVDPVVVGSMVPSRPLPGQEVRLVGSGFDWILPANVKVLFPTAAGNVAAQVKQVLRDTLRVVVPAGVVSGSVVVEQFTGTASLGFAPSVGSLRVVAKLPWGKAVDGFKVEVQQDGKAVVSGTTGGDGTVTFAGLYTGSYKVGLVGEPDGFHATAPGGAVSVNLDATTEVALSVTADAKGLKLAPSSVTMNAPGEEATVVGTVLDVDGDAIPGASVIYSVNKPAVLDVAVSGSTVKLKGLTPGKAELKGETGAVNQTAAVEVKGAVKGSVKTGSGKGVSGSKLTLFSGDAKVADQTTGSGGAFRFTALALASYRLEVTSPRDGFVSPSPASAPASVAEGVAEPELAFTVRAQVKKLTLSAAKLVFKAPGEESTLTADARDVDNEPISDASPVWASTDSAVAKVAALSPSARVTAISPGSARVTASADGTEAGADVEVHGAVAGSVSYRYGDAFPDATLKLLKDGSEVGKTSSGADGAFQFVDLSAGSYTVVLELADGFSVADSSRRNSQVATGQATPRVSYTVNPEARRVAASPDSLTLQLGDSATAQADAFDARDKKIPDQTFTWASSDAQVGTVRANSPTATLKGVGPGRAHVTVTAGAVKDTVLLVVRGAIRGTVRLSWGDPFQGATLRLQQGAAEVRPAQTTGADGTFAFTDLDPGAFTLSIQPPAGYQVDGQSTRSITVGPGLQPLDIRLLPDIQRVEISPADPALTVGETLDITAKAYDSRNNAIPQFRSIAWTSLDPAYLAASGSSLNGKLIGVAPGDTVKDRKFRILLNGQAFDFRATIRSFIEGTVTDSAGKGVQGITVGLGRTADSVIVADTRTDGRGNYRLDQLFAKSYAVAPLPPSGMTANPQFALINLGPSTPKGKANFQLIAAGGGRKRRSGDIAIYKNYNAWFGENKDETVLQAAPFNLTKGVGYFVRPMSDLAAGIPSTTSLIIFTSAGLGNQSSQITQQNNPAAQINLAAWVTGGGWLVAHLGDNAGGQGYMIPGLLGIADDVLSCSGVTLTVADHALIRGPDARLGTADDLNNNNIDNGGRFCYDNHGSLAGILPPGAEVLMTEQGGAMRPVYATYTFGAGRVIVTTLTLEFGSHTLQTLVNHFYWAVNGLDAGPAPALAGVAGAPAVQSPMQAAPDGELLRTDVIPPELRGDGAQGAPASSELPQRPAPPRTRDLPVPQRRE